LAEAIFTVDQPSYGAFDRAGIVDMLSEISGAEVGSVEQLKTRATCARKS
jgi:hypothetical protein